MGDDFYTRKFGGDRVTKRDVLHVVDGNPLATIVADLTCADNIPSDTFDCIIFTQTLEMIYDPRAALRHLYRILKPGGVLLSTSGGIKKIGRHEGVDPWGEYWHFTSQAVGRLFQEIFPAANVRVGVYGNVLATVATLHGLAAEELRQAELDYLDPDYEVLITVRAAKSGATL
jgi:SAM-dependent methyltransferase